MNNCVKNLEWVTQSENNIHVYDNGLAYTKGERHHFSKYSDELIHSICKLLEKGKETYEIIVELNLVDMNRYNRSSPEYIRIKNIIKALRRKKFRRDIVSLYDF